MWRGGCRGGKQHTAPVEGAQALGVSSNSRVLGVTRPAPARLTALQVRLQQLLWGETWSTQRTEPDAGQGSSVCPARSLLQTCSVTSAHGPGPFCGLSPETRGHSQTVGHIWFTVKGPFCLPHPKI